MFSFRFTLEPNQNNFLFKRPQLGCHVTVEAALAAAATAAVSFYLLTPSPFPHGSLTLSGASLSRDSMASKKQPVSLGE